MIIYRQFHFLILNRHELTSECWKQDPSTRPSFAQLIEKLEVIMQKDVPYLDLGKHDESSPYYHVPPGASTADESKLKKWRQLSIKTKMMSC